MNTNLFRQTKISPALGSAGDMTLNYYIARLNGQTLIIAATTIASAATALVLTRTEEILEIQGK